MLSRSHRFLFIHIPKTAGNSIQDVLRDYSDDVFVSRQAHQDGVERFGLRSRDFNTLKHSTLAEYRRAYGAELFGGLYKFACVRNPWDRAVSQYFSPGQARSAWDREEFARFLPEVRPVADYLSISSEPVQGLADAARNVDALMRFEKLAADFQRVCRQIGVPPPPLPTRNRSARASYHTYYDAETADLVARRFRDEIDFFGYTFE